jgi:hypothetical protein
VANGFSNCFKAITEKIEHLKHRERRGRFISWKLPSIKKPITEAAIKIQYNTVQYNTIQ